MRIPKITQQTARAFSWLGGSIAVLLCGAGASFAEVVDEERCSAQPDVRCIVDIARSSLREIDDDSDWVTAAMEIATALNSSGLHEQSRELLVSATARSAGITSSEGRATALLEIAAAASNGSDLIPRVLARATTAAGEIDDENKRWDAIGKIAVARAAGGNTEAALSRTWRTFPKTPKPSPLTRRGTLHDIAPLQAEQANFERGTRYVVIDRHGAYVLSGGRPRGRCNARVCRRPIRVRPTAFFEMPTASLANKRTGTS